MNTLRPGKVFSTQQNSGINFSSERQKTGKRNNHFFYFFFKGRKKMKTPLQYDCRSEYPRTLNFISYFKFHHGPCMMTLSNSCRWRTDWTYCSLDRLKRKNVLLLYHLVLKNTQLEFRLKWLVAVCTVCGFFFPLLVGSQFLSFFFLNCRQKNCENSLKMFSSQRILTPVS